MKKQHPYSAAIEKLSEVIETDRFLTLVAVNELTGATADYKTKKSQSITAQITVEVYLTSDEAEEIRP